jgi:hypothetical protein
MANRVTGLDRFDARDTRETGLPSLRNSHTGALD